MDKCICSASHGLGATGSGPVPLPGPLVLQQGLYLKNGFVLAGSYQPFADEMEDPWSREL